MIKYIPAGAVATLFLIAWSGTPSMAQEIVLNDTFEMQHWDFWTLTGNVPSGERRVLPFDTSVPGKFNYAYSQHTWDGISGGLAQTLFVQSGVTYSVSVKLAYDTC